MVTGLGVDPRRIARSLTGIPAYIRDAGGYAQRHHDGEAFPIRLPYLQPRLDDRRAPGGTAEGHYFHQDLWAARRIHRADPKTHVDVGSRIDGFVSHLLVFREVTVIDARPVAAQVPGLSFREGDVRALRYPTDGLESVSCLHALEHVGLGRYNDEVDPEGWRRGLEELQRVLAVGGRLYLGVPVGRERLCFNAHRVFAPRTIPDHAPRLALASFSYVDDAGAMHEDVDLASVPELEYGCGLFEFTKPARDAAT